MDDNANPIAISSRESNNEANRLEGEMGGERRGEGGVVVSSRPRGVVVQQCTLGGENTFGINGGQVGYRIWKARVRSTRRLCS